jgi:hypothetical protein
MIDLTHLQRGNDYQNMPFQKYSPITLVRFIVFAEFQNIANLAIL